MPRQGGRGSRRTRRAATVPRRKHAKSPAELGGPQYYTQDRKPSVGMPAPGADEED